MKGTDVTEEEFDETYSDAFEKLHGLGFGRAAIREFLLVAAAFGSSAGDDVEVTFAREGGYVVTKDGEIA